MLVHLCQTELMISHEKQAQILFLGFSLSTLSHSLDPGLLLLTAGCHLALTQLDVTVQREEDVAGFQVSVDDFVFVEVDERLQSLPTHHPDLRLCQGSLQLCGERVRESHESTLTIPHILMQPNHRW